MVWLAYVDVDLVIGLQPENIKHALQPCKRPAINEHPVTPEDFANPELREILRKEKNMLVLRLWSDVHRRTPIDVFVYEPFDFQEEFARQQLVELPRRIYSQHRSDCPRKARGF